MISLQRFGAVAKKEVLELKRDKLFFLMTILAPLLLYFLFAYGFPLDVKNMPIGVLDLDRSPLSRALIDRFEGTQVFQIKHLARETASLEKALKLGTIRAGLIIPSDFSRNIRKGIPTRLQILVDATYPNRANLAAGYAEATVGSFKMEILNEFFTKTMGAPGQVNMPIDLAVSAWYNPSFRSEDFIIPGIIAIVMMFFPPLVAAVSLAKEKETGSILNMYCSRLTKSEYLLGKMAPYVAISFVNFLIFFLCSLVIFQVPMRGDLATLLLMSFFYVASAIGIGLLVAVWVPTQIAAILIVAVGTLTPSFLYSGFMVPISSMGPDAQYISSVIPATYYIDGIRKLMVKGVGFAEVRFDVIWLGLACVVLFGASILFFKKRLG